MTKTMGAKERHRRPQYLWRCWGEIANGIKRARKVALFVDFDGTLVRIQRDPNRVKLARGVRLLLGRISKKGAVVGIVSGRRLSDVQRRVGLKQIWYAGAHGLFLRDPSNRSIALVAPKQLEAIRKARRTLKWRLRNVPGVRLEPKGATVAVHYRGATKKSERAARDVVTEVLKEHRTLCMLAGKKVLELLPDSRTDKWSAIQFILKRQQKDEVRRRRAIFIGDDVTDERVFERLRGVTIAVRKRQRTAARYYLRSPAEVRRFLETVEEWIL